MDSIREGNSGGTQKWDPLGVWTSLRFLLHPRTVLWVGLARFPAHCQVGRKGKTEGEREIAGSQLVQVKECVRGSYPRSRAASSLSRLFPTMCLVINP